jgi:hypothetical protein
MENIVNANLKIKNKATLNKVKIMLFHARKSIDENHITEIDKALINKIDNISFNFNEKELEIFNTNLMNVFQNYKYEEDIYFAILNYSLISNIMKDEFLYQPLKKQFEVVKILIEGNGIIDYKNYKYLMSTYLNSEFYKKLEFISKKTFTSNEVLFLSLVDSGVKINLNCLDETYNNIIEKKEKPLKETEITTMTEAYIYLMEQQKLLNNISDDYDYSLTIKRFKKFISKNNDLKLFQMIIKNLNSNDPLLTKFRKLNQFLSDYENINGIDLGYQTEIKR